MTRAIPEIDLHLLEGDRELLLEKLKHAVIEYGFFYITNYEEHLDDNVVKLLVNQSQQFFDLPSEEKNNIEMANSKHFLGYNGLKKENTSGKIDWREQIDFCSTDSLPAKIESIYENLIGPNQYPDSEKFPHFKGAVANFFYALNQLSILITETLFDALGVQKAEGEKYINFKDKQQQFAKMKVVHYPSQMALSKEDDASDQGCGAHKDSGFLTFLFQPTLTENSLQVQDIYGNWIAAPPKPNTIVVNVGQTLQYLTQGVCISSIHQVVAPKNGSRISIPYFQNVKLDARLEPFTLPQSLLDERDAREKERTQSVGFQFRPEKGEPVSKAIFYNRVKAHRDVAERWYPDILAKLDKEALVRKQEEEKIQGAIVNSPRLTKVFNSLDNIIHINIPGRTADIKLHSLRDQVKRLSGINVELDEFLQVAYLWHDFVHLKLDDHDEYVIDIAQTVSKLSINDLPLRQKTFKKRLEVWVAGHPGQQVPLLAKSELEGPSRNMSPRKKNKVQVLEKSPRKAVDKNSGLTLSERIRLKEQQRLSSQTTPEQDYTKLLDSKLPRALDIVASLRSDKTHSIVALTRQFQRSLESTSSALSAEESRDLVLRLNTKFPQVFKMSTGRDVSVLRWDELQLSELRRQLR